MSGMTKTLLNENGISKTGWTFKNDITPSDWKGKGEALADFTSNTTNWMWGDWWNAGHAYGIRGDLVNSPNWKGPAYQTLKDNGWVCSMFEKSFRKDLLSFTHYKAVAKCELDVALDWLKQAEENHWSISTLKSKMLDKFRKDNATEEPEEKKEEPKTKEKDTKEKIKEEQERNEREWEKQREEKRKQDENKNENKNSFYNDKARQSWEEYSSTDEYKEELRQFAEMFTQSGGTLEKWMNEDPKLKAYIIKCLKQYYHPDKETGDIDKFNQIKDL